MKRFVNKRTLTASAVALVVIGGFYLRERATIMNESLINVVRAASAAIVTLPFKYAFSVDGTLEEIGSIENSSSPYWWLSSGGVMRIQNGVGQTNQGDMAIGSKWQKLYLQNNPIDTDGGLHPQNIFRMVLRSNWQDISQSIYYKINRLNLSASPNRNASNGLLEMSRYLDQNNLYYTGLRVDGYAIIKKKYQGKYYTMAYNQVIKGPSYDPTDAPNLLPVGSQIGLKTVTKNLSGGRVLIDVYADFGRTGTWTKVAEAVDDGRSFGGAALTDAGHTGLRTDFMDVEFDDYTLTAP